MYEALLKSTPEYQKIAASLASPGPAALFGLPPAGRALLYASLQKDTGRVLCIVTPGEAEATHFADDLKTLGLSAASTSTGGCRCWAHWRADDCRPSASPPKPCSNTRCRRMSS